MNDRDRLDKLEVLAGHGGWNRGIHITQCISGVQIVADTRPSKSLSGSPAPLREALDRINPHRLQIDKAREGIQETLRTQDPEDRDPPPALTSARERLGILHTHDRTWTAEERIAALQILERDARNRREAIQEEHPHAIDEQRVTEIDRAWARR